MRMMESESEKEMYESIPEAARLTGVPVTKIRYWLLIDANFPHGVRGRRVVLRPSEVAEYFRRLQDAQSVVELHDNEGDQEGEDE